MDENTRKLLLDAGVNLETAMGRFMGNEALVVRFLKKFCLDKNYESLKEAMAEKDYGKAFNAAHTMKGLCGNLSLDVLSAMVSEEVELLRGGMNEAAEKKLPDLMNEYERVLKILNQL